MTVSFTGVQQITGAINMERGYSCFICGHEMAGFDLPVLVKNKTKAGKLAKLFNEKVPNSARIDFRSLESVELQVQIFACTKHWGNLELLQSKMNNNFFICSVGNEIQKGFRPISAKLIDTVRPN